MRRRNFLVNTATATAGLMIAPAIMKAKKDFSIVPNESIQSLEDDNVIIILELFGGNDGLNTIVPADDDEYYKIRKNIGMPKTIAVKVNDIYMNPGLVNGISNDGLKGMFEDGRLAVVEGIGYDSPNMSHFRSEDIWMSGINPKSNNNVRLLEGWLGRYFANQLPNFPIEIPEHPLSIAIDGTIPLMFKSDKGHMGIAMYDPDEFFKLGAGLTPFENLLPGTNNYEKEFNFVYTLARQSEVYSTAVKTAFDKGNAIINSKSFSSTLLSKRMKLIAQLIAGGLKTKVYFVRLSNFDSHAQQANADFSGQHFSLLNDAARAITELMTEARAQGFSERITGMTVSEFGRRAYDNGSRGTDHGAASMQFIWGDDKFVNGGYWNNRPNLTDLDLNGNVKYQTDYRVIYTEILEKRLGASPSDVTAVFGESFLPLNILEKRTSSAEDYIKPKYGDYVQISPNPCTGSGFISFDLHNPGMVDITIFNLQGKEELIVQRNFLNEGFYSIPFLLNKQGTFICSVTAGRKRYNQKFLVIR